ncbi:YciI family protein [Microvirga rosea]|uniref:YciI family protein n=1 Tax=Microvirga rosea TaxID=2715425 RepID=UPI001D0BABEF|nr:YciI family protein [Microvirga rosea]MCB8819815.1 YciI family protein [Microvirga rosea]
MNDTEFLIRLGGIQPDRMTPDVLREHVAYLHRLHAAGQLLFCGPCEDGTAIIGLRCSGRDEAQRIADDDPIAEAAVFTERTVVSIRLGTPENNFLLRP